MFATSLLSLHAPSNPTKRVLLFYTGGTLGMQAQNNKLLQLSANAFIQNIQMEVGAGALVSIQIDLLALKNPIDSANISSTHWMALARCIEQYYDRYDGFVVLHGTDTLAYTAAALSYVLAGLDKPVVLTGAQRVVSQTDNDVRHNVCHAIEVATAYQANRAVVQEVCVFFDKKLLRASRAVKVSAQVLAAFDSPNAPYLGVLTQAGFRYDSRQLLSATGPLTVQGGFDDSVGVLYLHPALSQKAILAWADIGLRGIVLCTYGLGNAPAQPWFIEAITALIARGICVLNVSACLQGAARHRPYAGSLALQKIGVIAGEDMTIEAAVVKMMWALFETADNNVVKERLETLICGEKTPECVIFDK